MSLVLTCLGHSYLLADHLSECMCKIVNTLSIEPFDSVSQPSLSQSCFLLALNIVSVVEVREEDLREDVTT